MEQQFVDNATGSTIAAPENTTPHAADEPSVINSAQQQIKLLAASNACLRRNLVQFSRRLKQELEPPMHRDTLTGLPDRRLLLDRLHQAMRQAIRQQKFVLLLLVDLDDFKWVNEHLGVAAGNNLLQQVALRLAAGIRGGDTVCRYGGNEFVLMLPEIDGEQSAAAALQKIRTQLAGPYAIDDQRIMLNASIGSKLYRGAELNGEDLIQQAASNLLQNRLCRVAPTYASPVTDVTFEREK